MLRLADSLEDAARQRQSQLIRADITDGEFRIHMVSPSNPHGVIVMRVGVQISRQDPGAVVSVENRIHHPGVGMVRTPDLIVMSQEAFEGQEDDYAVFAPDIALAVEVVSHSNPGNDYVAKLRDYPRMGVPVYMIIDPREGTASVHSSLGTTSGQPGYAETARCGSGGTVRAADWDIDTTGFPRYRS
ncbi:Uma2 family endonuclease [Streptomyces boncukensis]|uniref:Uma2 family endonuclease n=1 Tax=Streptomyces boncukensis TaxID=2711219 RepID=A0A6G4WZZ6_9ACTN|nr:Uma2 family endonuclease [Streptomyces boncukensis]NGO69991.1 Uma2 family endonuclease [Streptomyces boncukensis]